jgi:GAF domain-containing protein
VTDVKHPPGRPKLDAESFQRLLEAAYVLQQHNDRIRQAALIEAGPPKNTSGNVNPAQPTAPPPPASADYTQVLSEIVSTQQSIQGPELDFQQALNIIADRTLTVARAQGVAIGMLEKGEFEYRAAAGQAATLLGTRWAPTSAMSSACLAGEPAMRVDNCETDTRFDPALCRSHRIQSFAAVPIYYQGAVAGAIELHYSTQRGFTDHDLRACQLMAGLASEARARAEELAWKRSLAAEKEAMLATLEQIRPQLELFASVSAAVPKAELGAPATPSPGPAIATFLCKGCGAGLAPDQKFCGICGTLNPSSASDSGSAVESAETEHPKGAPAEEPNKTDVADPTPVPSHGPLLTADAPAAGPKTRFSLAKPFALLALLCLLGTTFWINSPRNSGWAASNQSLVEPVTPRAVPPAREFAGNPEAQVWIDTDRRNYHCPGTPLYGKTPQGRFDTQRNAQLEKLDAVDGKVCE